MNEPKKRGTGRGLGQSEMRVKGSFAKTNPIEK
jgi:hypothetical protein